MQVRKFSLTLVAAITIITSSVSVAIYADDVSGQRNGEKGEFAPNPPSEVGLSYQRTLGLSGARHRGSYRRGFRPYWHSGNPYPGPYRFGYRGYGYYWEPWHTLPQSMKIKTHYPAVYATPRLGLQYNYPYPSDMGLNLPPETDDPVIESWPNSHDNYISPQLEDALDLMKEGRFSKAGYILADELKYPPVSLETYTVISVVLMATGKYTAAGKVFRYGIEDADTLEVLTGWNIADHFPSSKIFQQKLDAFQKSLQAGEEGHLLHAGLRLMSGDSEAMKELEELQQVGKTTARAAKKLYLHFIDTLFQEKEEPPAKPLKDALKKEI